jgi:predicted MFS family arabinose efflux permease
VSVPRTRTVADHFSQTTNKKAPKETTNGHHRNYASRPAQCRSTRSFLGALIGWVFDYYEVFLMTMLAVPIAVEFKLTTAQVGMIFSVQLLFLAVGGVFFGYLADRMGRKRVLIYTILIFSLGTMVREL